MGVPLPGRECGGSEGGLKKVTEGDVPGPAGIGPGGGTEKKRE